MKSNTIIHHKLNCIEVLTWYIISQPLKLYDRIIQTTVRKPGIIVVIQITYFLKFYKTKYVKKSPSKNASHFLSRIVTGQGDTQRTG